MLDFGVRGWMADFGEYLPTDDVYLANGVDAKSCIMLGQHFGQK